MSAYIVEKNHIVYLVAAAMSRRLNSYGGAFSWYHGAPRTRAELGCADYERAADVANMLWRENVASVSYRYPNESSATLPGPIDHAGAVVTQQDIASGCYSEIDPVQVMKSCHCYGYQTCERPDWEASEAFGFIKALESAAAHSLTGYDDAIWGAPEPERGVFILGALASSRRRR